MLNRHSSTPVLGISYIFFIIFSNYTILYTICPQHQGAGMAIQQLCGRERSVYHHFMFSLFSRISIGIRVFWSFGVTVFIRILSVILILSQKMVRGFSSCLYITLLLHFSESTLKSRMCIPRCPQVGFSGGPKRRDSFFRFLDYASKTIKKNKHFFDKKMRDLLIVEVPWALVSIKSSFFFKRFSHFLVPIAGNLMFLVA